MLYVDVSVRNPKNPNHLIRDLPRIFTGHHLTYGGGSGTVLNISAAFNRITSPVLGLLVAKWSLRKHISRKSEVEYRVYYR